MCRTTTRRGASLASLGVLSTQLVALRKVLAFGTLVGISYSTKYMGRPGMGIYSNSFATNAPWLPASSSWYSLASSSSTSSFSSSVTVTNSPLRRPLTLAPLAQVRLSAPGFSKRRHGMPQPCEIVIRPSRVWENLTREYPFALTIVTHQRARTPRSLSRRLIRHIIFCYRFAHRDVTLCAYSRLHAKYHAYTVVPLLSVFRGLFPPNFPLPASP